MKLRQAAMGPEIEKLKAVSFDQGEAKKPPENLKGGGEPKAKAKPVSRRLSTNISQCSAKITEIVSWEAKLAENKAGLKLTLGYSVLLFFLI